MTAGLDDWKEDAIVLETLLDLYLNIFEFSSDLLDLGDE